jgi:hypothetical protein
MGLGETKIILNNTTISIDLIGPHKNHGGI